MVVLFFLFVLFLNRTYTSYSYFGYGKHALKLLAFSQKQTSYVTYIHRESLFFVDLISWANMAAT